MERWYALKLFERDEKVKELLNLEQSLLDHIETDILACEKEMMMIRKYYYRERYRYIGEIIEDCYKKRIKTPDVYVG